AMLRHPFVPLVVGALIASTLGGCEVATAPAPDPIKAVKIYKLDGADLLKSAKAMITFNNIDNTVAATMSDFTDATSEVESSVEVEVWGSEVAAPNVPTVHVVSFKADEDIEPQKTAFSYQGPLVYPNRKMRWHAWVHVRYGTPPSVRDKYLYGYT